MSLGGTPARRCARAGLIRGAADHGVHGYSARRCTVGTAAVDQQVADLHPDRGIAPAARPGPQPAKKPVATMSETRWVLEKE